MKSKTPFLTGFSTSLCGSAKRNLQECIRRRRRDLAQGCLGAFARQFSDIVAPETLESLAGDARKRVFCSPVTFWAWLSQILAQNDSCSAAVSRVQSWCAEGGLPLPSSATTAYCKARLRLGLDFIASVNEGVVGRMDRSTSSGDLYRGMVVKSVDGSSVQLMDTADNQAKYPQPSNQKAGCGFPVMKFVGVLNHAHGAWEKHLTATCYEKDPITMRRMLDHFGDRTLLLADRAFCSFEIIARLLERGTHSLMRLHQMREKGYTLRKGKRIGKNQRLVTWKKPATKPGTTDLDDEQWSALPDTLEMRMIVFWYEDREGGGKRMILATTLLDHEEYDWTEMADLYASRWDIELRLRDVKTTLGMEALNVKTPAMAHKSLEMALLGYNLIKATCQRGAQRVGISWKEVSFKGTLDALQSLENLFHAAAIKSGRQLGKAADRMLEIVGTKLIDVRPNRWEPRMQKKRPKPLPFLDRPRQVYKTLRKSGKLLPA